METTKEASVHASMSSEETVQLSGLIEEEQELLEAALNGQCWVTVRNGRLESAPARDIPPSAVDEEMLPFWRKFDEEKEIQIQLFKLGPLPNWSSPSIIVQSLCGYNYTPELYRRDAALMEEYGFTCLRSRRGPDGRFWELWYLPGVWAAKGALLEAVGKHGSEKVKLERVLSFFESRKSLVTFGTLDVTVQRMAMRVE